MDQWTNEKGLIWKTVSGGMAIKYDLGYDYSQFFHLLVPFRSVSLL